MNNKYYLLDTFVYNDFLLLCFISEQGEKFFLYKDFKPTLYIDSSYSFIKNFSLRFKVPFFVTYKRDIYKKENVKVYGIRLNIRNFYKIKRFLLNKDDIKVFNADISPVLQFYFANNLFPLAKVLIEYENNNLTKIKSIDNPLDTDYSFPPLDIISISPVCNGNPKFSKWDGVEVKTVDDTFIFENTDNKDFYEKIADILVKYDPDVIITICGDPVIIPMLETGADHFNINMPLSRPDMKKIIKKKSQTLLSYGKVVFRDKISYLTGRIHIDIRNSFFVKHSDLNGLMEVSRLTSLPLQEAARISPGSAISTVQLKVAYKENFLIPSTKAYPEKFKRAVDLIKVDKGGIFYLPPVGNFSNVAEIDFFSMYPSIMSKYNISVETLNCSCCKNIADKIMIPGTDYYFCKKEKGIIPKTVEPLLLKRKEYKRLLKYKKDKIYNDRQNAIKWMLVTCFGYLGYKNAKFGCVEAHEATTAMGREILIRAKEIAEDNGFDIIYAITDSLYLFKEGALKEDYLNLIDKIEEITGFEIKLEGIYRFISFLPSTEDKEKQVMNKFYGIFENGEIKVRGLMLKRRDTPFFIKRFQEKLLTYWNNPEKQKELYDEAVIKLKNREIPFKNLTIKKRITKKINEYKNKTLHSIVASSLPGINPGESIEYVVTDNKSKVSEERAKLVEFADSYDDEFYISLLNKALNEVFIQK